MGPATGETVWCLSNDVSKPLFAGLLKAFAEAVGAGPSKRVVLLLDNAGFHTRPISAVPDGITLVYPPPCSPELQPAETLWPLVDEPIVNRLVPTLDALVDTVGARCCDLTERQTEISSRTNFARWPKDHARPSLSEAVPRPAREPAIGVDRGSPSSPARPLPNTASSVRP